MTRRPLWVSDAGAAALKSVCGADKREARCRGEKHWHLVPDEPQRGDYRAVMAE
jgi:hypothetical protein